jgi:hypothetical protein
MNSVYSLLEERQDLLTGRKPTESEVLLLLDGFSNFPLTSEFVELLKLFNLIGQTFSLTENKDASGMGVEMEWMTPQTQIDEAFRFYPGLAVHKLGYLPLGECMQGSGDPYFLKKDESIWNVYRVPHDLVWDSPTFQNSIELVTSFYNLIEDGLD